MGWFNQFENALWIGGKSPFEIADERANRDAALDDLVSSTSTTGITDRNLIINPSSIMSQYSFGNSAEERRKYNEYLNALKALQSQQQASYDEWYGTPEQQVVRDRSAGLNTDILGLSGSTAPETATNNFNPLDGVPSNLDIATGVISSISGVVSSLSSVASLATAFTDIPLKKQDLQNAKLLGEQLDLQNESLLGVMMARDIADLYGTAQQVHMKSDSTEPFNMEAWFGDDANFAPLTAVYGNNPRYDAQLNKQRNAVLEHMRAASASQKDLASNIYDTGVITSSPYFSTDQKITMLQLVPFTKACSDSDLAEIKLRETLANIRSEYSSGLNIKTAVDVANAKNEYDASYYDEANGKMVAAFEQFIRDCATPAYELEKSINQGYLDLFNQDPSGIGAWKAAYLYGSNGGSSWKEAYLARMDDTFNTLIDSEIAIAQATGDFARLSALANVLQNFTPSLEKPDINFVQYYRTYYEKIEKVLNLMGEDVDIIN